MKWLVLLSSLLFSSVGAQTRISVMYVYTPDAATYVQQNLSGQTIQQNAAALTSQVNSLYAGTGIQFDMVSATVPYCCGPEDHLWSLPATSVTAETVGAGRWAQRDIGIEIQREYFKADVVIIVGDYDRGEIPSNDVPGLSLGVCTSAGRNSADGFVGINIHHQYYLSMNQSLLAHELAHQLCMNDEQGWYMKTGSTPDDCWVRWSMEYGDGTSALKDYPATPTQPAFTCPNAKQTPMFASTSGVPGTICSNNSGIGWTPRGGAYQALPGTGSAVGAEVCNEVAVGARWYWNGNGFQYFELTGPFTCSGSGSSSGYCVAPLKVCQYGNCTDGNTGPTGFVYGQTTIQGTLVRNTVAAMQAQAPQTALFRNTKRSINMITNALATLFTF